MRAWTFFVLLFALQPSGAQTSKTVVIEGQVLERGTQRPIKDANVFILPQKLKATTDDKGRFRFASVPDGSFSWIVNQTGYQKFEAADATDDPTSRILYVEKESYSGFETTIVGQKDKRDMTKKTLDQSQFLTLPGSGGDPVKAVQNLPGVNRAGGLSSKVIIQGSAPEDTRYDLEGHEIPMVFHFGGLTSVVMPEAISQVDYLSAGFGPEYSRVMGGIISLKTRDADVKDRDSKGFFFADTLKTGGLWETKIRDHESLLVSGRYSYIGLFLKAAMKGQDDFNLTVAPEFSDLTLVYKNDLSEVDKLRINFLASRDTMAFVFKEPNKEEPALKGDFHLETGFYRVIPEWTHKVDAERSFKFSSGIGQDLTSVAIGDIFFETRSRVITSRGEWEQAFTPNWKTQWGLDTDYAQSNISFRVPSSTGGQGGVRNPTSSSETRDATFSTSNLDSGVYWRNEIKTETPWTYLPSLRLDSFGSTRETPVSPRFMARYQWSDSFLLKGATGLYYQPAQAREVSSQYGNPDLKSAHAVHFMLGFEKDFREGRQEGYQFSANYFRRDFQNLVISSSDAINRGGVMVPEVYNNQGRGRAHGIETQLRYDRVPWSGWISYTLSESKRWDNLRSEYPFQYDQTHNLNVVGAYDYGKNWKISGRYRYVTGNPLTPVIGGVFDADNDVYQPVRGGFYSDRNSPFQQLDLRIDKKWISDTEVWSFYVDIQNVLNAKNVEDVRYSYDYSKKESVNGLSFLPAIGAKGEF